VDYSGELAKLKDIRGEGAARPIGTTLELPAEVGFLHHSLLPRSFRLDHISECHQLVCYDQCNKFNVK
jgi:hypothetical protein